MTSPENNKYQNPFASLPKFPPSQILPHFPKLRIFQNKQKYQRNIYSKSMIISPPNNFSNGISSG
jgi:hypothetical protein